MTDDPSTNSGEWVCGTCGDDPLAHATPGSTCVWEPTLVTTSPAPDDHDGYTINLGAPSVVVQDSERPGYQPPEFIRCDWCGRHGHCGNVICEVCAEKAAAPVPSPVPRRPDTAQIRAMADEITTTGSGFPGLDTLDALTLILAADWIDAHRCPTPEPEFYGRLVCASCGQVPSAHIGPVGNYCPGPLPTPERDDLAELRAATPSRPERHKAKAIQPAADQGPDLSEAAALLDEYDQSVHNLTRFGTVEAQTDHLLASERVAAFARRLLDREGGT